MSFRAERRPDTSKNLKLFKERHWWIKEGLSIFEEHVKRKTSMIGYWNGINK